MPAIEEIIALPVALISSGKCPPIGIDLYLECDSMIYVKALRNTRKGQVYVLLATSLDMKEAASLPIPNGLPCNKH